MTGTPASCSLGWWGEKRRGSGGKGGQLPYCLPDNTYNTSQTPDSWPPSWPVKPQGPPRPFVSSRRQVARPAQPLRPSSGPSIPRTPAGARMLPFGPSLPHCCLVASPLIPSAFSCLPSAGSGKPEAVSSARLACLAHIFFCSFLLLARPPVPSCWTPSAILPAQAPAVGALAPGAEP